jgi:hypothetical protein
MQARRQCTKMSEILPAVVHHISQYVVSIPSLFGKKVGFTVLVHTRTSLPTAGKEINRTCLQISRHGTLQCVLAIPAVPERFSQRLESISSALAIQKVFCRNHTQGVKDKHRFLCCHTHSLESGSTSNVVIATHCLCSVEFTNGK